MVKLESENRKYYEYDPVVSLFDEDAWEKYYRGICPNASVSREVRIYDINTKYRLPEHLLQNQRVLAHFCYSHPNIIPITDFVVNYDELQASDCRLFFIEEYLSGIPLSYFLYGQTNASKDKAINEFCSVFQRDRVMFAKKMRKEILQGVDFIHPLVMRIRYVNPKRLIETDDGVVKISIKDRFMNGVSCYINSDGFTSGRGTFICSFPIRYCSPEMILIYERSLIDSRSDIYSVGILLFQMLTGHTPYKGKDLEIMFQQLTEKMLLNLIEDKQIRKISKKATEKDPAKRFQSSIEFLNAIDKMDEGVPWYKNFNSFFSPFREKKRLVCVFISILVAFTFCLKSDAQNTMRINYKDCSVLDVPIERIDSITFIAKEVEQQNKTLIGEWFWGNKEKGYYEVMAFNEDRTYIGYDYYLEYGFDTWTYGTYMANGIMLNLWSNGFGYRRTYRWFVTGLTENALEVMTQMGSFIYYRIQPEVYSLKVGEKSYVCKNGDYYVFADGVKVLDEEGKLKGVSEGTTYILKYNAEPGLIMAYKVIVEK